MSEQPMGYDPADQEQYIKLLETERDCTEGG